MTDQKIRPEHDLPAVPRDALARWIQISCEQHPDATILEYGIDGEPEQHCAAELMRQARLWIPSIRQIDSADPLLLCFTRVTDFIPAAWAAIFCGRWTIPWQLSAGTLGSPAAQMRFRALRECFPKLVLLHGPRESEVASWVLAQATNWRAVTKCEPGAAQATAAEVMLSPGGGSYMPTSGSSGHAKFARISDIAFSSRAGATSGVKASSIRELMCFPFDGITGGAARMPWRETRIVLPGSRLLQRPDEALHLIARDKIQSLALSTTLLAKIVSAMEASAQACDWSALYELRLGSEAISAALLKRFIHQYPRFAVEKCRFLLGYGMTETGIISQIAFQDAFALIEHVADGDLPVALGPAVPNTSLRICDDEGRELEEGAEGEIQVSAPDRSFDGYQTAQGLDRSCFTDDGWFRTGDLGWIENGQLTVAGRASGSMRIGGRTVSLESIELALGKHPDLVPGTFAAVPVRMPGELQDELGLFFALAPQRQARTQSIARELRLSALRQIGVSPRHLVCVPEAQFPRTASYKTIRVQLAQTYLAGQWPAVQFLDEQTVPDGQSDVERRLRLIWAQVLNIAPDFDANRSFYDLGADSLHLASMVIETEAQFRKRIPLEQFFRQPTLANLVHYLQKQQTEAVAAPAPAPSAPGPVKLARSLESALRSWPGDRASPTQLMPSIHGEGTRTPLFWVFQNEGEFQSLGEALGPHQPLYGLRSLVGLVRIRDYDREALDVACDLYLPELESLRPQGPIVLGGNCQGAIVALALARRLRRAGRTAQTLILMEWSYSYGPYAAPVALLYGNRSYTARFFTAESRSPQAPDWQKDFPRRTVLPIEGEHGQFFTKANVPVLAARISEVVGC